MKVVICGSRYLPEDAAGLEMVGRAVDDSGFEVTEVVSGGAPGADRLGERWARGRGLPVRVFPADWKAEGRSAGPRRNGRMAAYADAVVALPRGESRGTRDMVAQARAKGLSVFVVEVPE